MSAPTFTAVAWVPYTLHRETAMLRPRIASAWLRGHAGGRRAVLRVPSHADDYTRRGGSYADFARNATVVTDRGAARASGPTLVPDAHTSKLIAGGMSCADGDSLVLVEHPSVPLAAWAAAVGASNLLNGEVATPIVTDAQREVLDHLVWITYNGWTSPPGDDAARYELPRLAASGMDWKTFVGSMLALAPNRMTDLKRVLKVAPLTWQEQATSHSANVMAPWRDLPESDWARAVPWLTASADG